MSSPRKRDDNEPAIIAALRAVGATVQTLDETGCPDLLIGFRGRTYLIEVKDQHGRAGKGAAKTASGLRETQEGWWRKWRGAPPMVATTPEEALKVIGAVVIGNQG